ncbi:MAG: thioredoxin family protein [Fimbriimonas ginsengisoli]|nr:thioredoxin family protein [Fimbriimonas ginsengisoli]
MSVALATTKVKPRAVATGVAKITFAPGLHGYQNPPSESYLIPVGLKIDPPFTLAGVKYPAGVDATVGGADKPVKTYSGTIAIPFSFRAPQSGGKQPLRLRVTYQQCDETTCYPPSEVSAVTIVEVAAGVLTAPVPNQPPLLVKPVRVPAKLQGPPTPAKGSSKQSQTAPSPSVVNPSPTTYAAVAATTTPTQPAPEREGLAGWIKHAFGSGNFWLIVPLLFLAGLAINLTPCVYPMVPITLSFFANQAHGSRATRLGLGFMYLLGIALMYGTLGGVAASLGATFGNLFESRWFSIGLGALMIGLALSMFDLYQIGIPAPLARQLKGRSGAVGALIMGLLVGVAAAPCAGPLIVAILAEIARLRSAALGTALFVAVGLGLGLPYMLLGALSSGAKSLPKAGGWMKTLKALLGLVVIGVGLNYLLLAFQRNLGDAAISWVWVGFYAVCGLYLLVEHGAEGRAAWALKGVALLALGGLIGGSYQSIQQRQADTLIGPGARQIAWQPFTPESFEAAKKSGKPIVVDGSANWCVQCRELDERVFLRPEAVAAMQNVVTLRIDWSTGVDPAYEVWTAKLFGIKGLPHVEILKPGGERSEARDTLDSPDDLIAALRRAGAAL